MSKNLINWRKENLDSISPSFCAAKWYNSSIHLGSGETMSCHLPLPHIIDASEDELRSNPSLIHNTKHKKKMRQLMLDGHRPDECEYCWRIEDIQRENVSDRVFKSQIYKIEDIKKIPIMGANINVTPKTLEISFDRICNFGCSYCNAGYSTTWGSEIEKNGAYQYLKSDGGGAYQHSGKHHEPYGKFNEHNPNVRAFFDWWPKLATELQEIRITGGESTMSHNFWKFMTLLTETNNSQLSFAVNTNMGMKRELLEKLVEYSYLIKSKGFTLFTSNESYGAHAEYIRDGLIYDEWRSNLHYFLKNANYKNTIIMMTITSLSLFSITEFMDDMIELKREFNDKNPLGSITMDLNLLRFPSFMSPLAFPDEIKDYTRINLQNWYTKRKNDKLPNGHHVLTEHERSQIERLIDYIEVVDMPHRRVSQDKSLLWHDFKSFYSQYDERRGKDFKKTFPKIVTDWYDTIMIDKTIANTKLWSVKFK